MNQQQPPILPIQNLISEAKERIERAFLKAEQVYGRPFNRAKVAFDLKYGSSKAGTAQALPFRLIRINQQLLRQNPSHLLDVTCPHEVAHLVAFDLYGREGWGHGPRWKSVMTNIGLPPKRCHNLVTNSNLGKAVYECCGCKEQFISTNATHAKVKSGKLAFRPCKKCRGQFTFKGSVRELIKNKSLTCRELPDSMK